MLWIVSYLAIGLVLTAISERLHPCFRWSERCVGILLWPAVLAVFGYMLVWVGREQP